MKKNLLKKLELTTAGIVSLGLGAAITTNTVWVQAANKNQTVSVKKNAKGYVYKNKSLSKVSSKNVKKEFGNNKLVVKRLATIKRHGKKQQFDYLVDKVNHKKSGWVYDKSVQVNKAKKAKVAKKNYKKTSKKHEKQDDFFNNNNIKGIINDANNSDKKNNKHNNSDDEKVYSNSEAANIIKNKFMEFVNNERAKVGKEPWIESSGLNKIAEERASYVNPGSEKQAHYLDKNGNYHAEGANQYDGKLIGVISKNDNTYLGEDNAYSSNTEFNQEYLKGNLDNDLSNLETMITDENSGSPENDGGHRRSLLSEADYSNQKYIGVFVKVRNEDGDKTFVIDLVTSEKDY